MQRKEDENLSVCYAAGGMHHLGCGGMWYFGE